MGFEAVTVVEETKWLGLSSFKKVPIAVVLSAMLTTIIFFYCDDKMHNVILDFLEEELIII